jgi:hypothetical protein
VTRVSSVCPPEAIRHVNGGSIGPGGGQRLRGRDADQQGADQAGALRDGHELGVVERRARALERVVDDGVDQLEVVARGDLRHHAAEPSVHALRGDDVGPHLAVEADDGGAGVVAGRLDRQDHAGAAVRHMITASSPLSA